MPGASVVVTDRNESRLQSSTSREQSTESWPTSLACYVLSIEDCCRHQQRSKDIGAAYTAVMQEALPGDHRLEHVAPKVHVGGKEVGPQVLKELNATNNVEH